MSSQSTLQDETLRDPGQTRVLPHLMQLDGVRGIAVLFVMFHHFVPRIRWLRPDALMSFGVTGVGLFFVLSGFLITRILLQCRLEHAEGRECR